MLYEKYEKRIKRIAKIKHVIYKIRFVILGVVSAIAISYVTTNLVKGRISTSSSEYNIPTSFEYGTQYKPQADAVMGSANFEFAHKGKNDWSEIQPVEVGEYLARPYSVNGFGGKTIGKEFAFTICPRKFEISIHQTTITYGDKLTIDSSNLLNGDYVADFKETLTGDDLFEKEVSIDPESLVIKNQYGVEVTTSYEPVIKPHALKINKKNLNIKFNSDSKEFDGEKLQSGYNSQGLIEGDELSFNSEYKTITDIGSIDNTALSTDFTITRSSDGQDVTPYYDIKITSGTLTVNPIDISFKSSSVNREYNGLPLTDEGDSPELSCEITSGHLLPNHHIDVTYANKGIYSSLSTKNVVEVVIRDNEDNDVTNTYYTPHVSYGDLSINKIDITLKSPTTSKNYNKTALKGLYENDEKYIESGHLASTDSLTYKTDLEIINPSSITNYLDFDIINPSIGETFNKDECYNINYNYGTLTINKIPFDISSNNVGKTYDGIKLTSEGSNPSLYLDYDSSLLVEGHTLEATFLQENRLHNCANVDNSFIWGIYDENHNDVTNIYYDISSSFGLINIDKKSLNLSTSNKDKYYDGQFLSIQSKEEISGIKDIATTDEFVLNGSTNIVNPTNGAISISLDYSIYNGSIDVTDDYLINESFGTFNIKKRVINIETNSIDRFYDGELISEYKVDEEHTLSSEISFENGYGMLPGHELRISYDNEGAFITSLGPIDNSISYSIVETGTNNYISNWSDYYEVNVVTGTLNLKPVPLTIRSHSEEKVYDGEPLEKQSFDSTGLLNDDSIIFSGTIVEGINAPEGTPNTFNYSIENHGYLASELGVEYIDVTSCYDVTKEFGTLTMNKRTIVVDMPSFDITYNGEYHRIDEYESVRIDESSPYGLPSNQELVLIQKELYKKADTYLDENNVNNYVRICDLSTSNVKYVEENYEIIYINSPSVIRKMNITLSMNRTELLEKSFDGYSLSQTFNPYEYINVVGGFAFGDQLVITYENDAVNPSSGVTRINISVYNYLGNEETTDNYHFEIIDVTLEIGFAINKSAITIETFNCLSRSYNATCNVTNPNAFYVSGLSYNHNLINVNLKIDSYVPGDYLIDVDIENLQLIDHENGNTLNIDDYYSAVNVIKTGHQLVTPRSLELRVSNSEFVYNGYARTYLECMYYSGEGVLTTDELSIENVNDYSVTFAGETIPTNITSDDIHIKQRSSGTDVTNCYDISFDNCVLKINKMDIQIESATSKYTFNNSANSFNDSHTYVISQGSLSVLDTLNVSYMNSNIVNVGKYENTFEISSVIHDGEISDKAYNSYNFTKKFGTVTINPLAISYSYSSISKTYDGNSISINNQNLTYNKSNTLAYITSSSSYYALQSTGYRITATFNGSSYFTAGTYNLTPVITVFDANGNVDSNGNINLTRSGRSTQSKVTIEKRSITLTNNANQNDTTIIYGMYKNNTYTLYGNKTLSQSIVVKGTKLGTDDNLSVNGEVIEMVNYVESRSIDEYGDEYIVRSYTAERINAALNSMVANKLITIVHKGSVDVTSSYTINYNCVGIIVYYEII